MEAHKIGGLLDVFSFSKGLFSGSMLIFGGGGG